MKHVRNITEHFYKGYVIRHIRLTKAWTIENPVTSVCYFIETSLDKAFRRIHHMEVLVPVES